MPPANTKTSTPNAATETSMRVTNDELMRNNVCLLVPAAPLAALLQTRGAYPRPGWAPIGGAPGIHCRPHGFRLLASGRRRGLPHRLAVVRGHRQPGHGPVRPALVRL